MERCPVSSWEDKHKSSQDGRRSIICSPKMLEVVEGSSQEISSALECSWNTRLQQMAKSREAAYNLVSAAVCEIHTGLSGWEEACCSRLYPTMHDCTHLDDSKTQLSRLKIQDFNQETKLIHLCHSASEVRKARLHPSQGSRVPLPTANRPSAPEFPEKKGLCIIPTAECNLKIRANFTALKLQNPSHGNAGESGCY